VKTIFINGRFLTQQVTGVQRFARETLHALDLLLAARASSPFEFVLLAPRGAAAPVLRRIRFQCVGPFSGHVWEQITLPRASRGGFLLNFGPTGPLVKRRQIVTIHDASVHVVPHAFSRAFRTWYKLTLPILAQRSAGVMTVSDFSRSEVIRYFGARAQAVCVSGEGWQHVLRAAPNPDVLHAHGLRPQEYVLAVSSVAPHKNFGVVARALSHLTDCHLKVAVVGATNARIFGYRGRAELKHLEFLGYVDDSSLRALYENAAAFIHPSLYEGFGIPPLEAMALGCPVIASNAASIPEVCGPGAWYFDPEDEADLARQIRRILSRPDEREKLRQLARRQLQKHSWEACARVFLDQLESAADPHPSIRRAPGIPSETVNVRS
jgi:glycosyltransferase involved in cell wall biosynthesis